MAHDFRLGDCKELLKTIPDNSIDLCLTDPPYFLDGLGDDWDNDTINAKTNKGAVIGGLPKGMKFDINQGRNFQEFYAPVSEEIFRVLKPGAFFISFSAARLYHRMTIAIEDAGFEIRDMIGWTYEGQAKAFSQDYIISKQKNLSDQEKKDYIERCRGWKTPQLKPCIEPMALAQKPSDLKMFENFIVHNVGLMDTTQTINDKFPGNIIAVAKPSKKEKKDYNTHISVKPLTLLEHLIRLYTLPGAKVLDPFLGSGSTLIAANRTGRECIGFELETVYFNIIKQRLQDELSGGLFSPVP